MHILVTGCAGFIGATLCGRLLRAGYRVTGIDDLNAYYSVALKKARLQHFTHQGTFVFQCLDICDRGAMAELFQQQHFDYIIHLAAQAGVRHSISQPFAYVDANLTGFCHILEGARQQQVKHFVFASSSSVYGANGQQPFQESAGVDHPLALYGATKKANEVMAHSYASLYQLPCTGLRFFTVYGPWGRPDMALFKFTQSILADKPIDVYHHGDMARDFTYVEDIVEGIVRVMRKPATPNTDWLANDPDPASSYAPYRLYNIGHNQPTALLDFIRALEQALDKRAHPHYLPMQPGDVARTHADTTRLQRDFDFQPCMPLQEGIARFVAWYRDYYHV